jgi:hypothetical protein
MAAFVEVEVAPVEGAVVLRDMKDHGTGPALRVSPLDWLDFLAGSPVESLTISRHDRVTCHDGAWVHTRWHVRDQRGATLHFTDEEWVGFWISVLDDAPELFEMVD